MLASRPVEWLQAHNWGLRLLSINNVAIVTLKTYVLLYVRSRSLAAVHAGLHFGVHAGLHFGAQFLCLLVQASSRPWSCAHSYVLCMLLSQASFHLFGMELLAQLDLSATNAFFNTFFALPPTYWKGFLGSRLSSVQLLGFALLTFVLAPANIKGKLVSHLMTGEVVTTHVELAVHPGAVWVYLLSLHSHY